LIEEAILINRLKSHSGEFCNVKKQGSTPYFQKEVQMQKAFQLFFGGALAALIALVPIAAPAQVGTSCADCPNYSGAYSIENTTGTTIHYQYRWGDKHARERRCPCGDAKLASNLAFLPFLPAAVIAAVMRFLRAREDPTLADSACHRCLTLCHLQRVGL